MDVASPDYRYLHNLDINVCQLPYKGTGSSYTLRENLCIFHTLRQLAGSPDMIDRGSVACHKTMVHYVTTGRFMVGS